MKKYSKLFMHCLAMAIIGAGVAVMSIIVNTVIKYFWGTL